MSTYSLQRGDNLSRIAADNGISLEELLKLNPDIKDPNTVLIGQNINLPDATGGDSSASTDTPPANAASGDQSGTPVATHILSSPTLKWYYDSAANKWYASYTLQASGRELLFEATPDQIYSIFGTGNMPGQFTRMSLKDLTARSNVSLMGGIASMEGDGSFESEVSRVTTLALDEGRLPDWAAKDGAAMDIIFAAQEGGKSDDWVLQQLSKLPSFKDRFPGIDKLQTLSGMDLGDAINGWLQMEGGLKKALASAGYDPNAVTPSAVGDLLNKGWSLDSVSSVVTSWRQMEKFQPAMSAFNSILSEKGLQPITSLQQYMDFVQGRAPADMYDVWEASSVAEAAQQAGLGNLFTAEDAIRISLATDQSTSTATDAAQKAAALLLRLRHEVDVQKFGLTHEDLIDLSFGVSPRSGMSAAQVNDNVNRAVQAAQEYINGQNAQPYKSYTGGGLIQSQSLGNLRPQT